MTVEIACTRVRETDNAVLIHDHASDSDIWIPLSQVDSMHFDRAESGTICISDWIARQKGLVK
jgi:hypothetical protein